jgi:hypothetical protein
VSNTGPTVRGTLDATPCPHCGKKQDLRVFSEQQLIDTGHTFFCEDDERGAGCRRSYEVVAIQPVTIVTVRKDPRGLIQGQGGGAMRPNPNQRQQQAQPKGLGGVLSRLLGKG